MQAVPKEKSSEGEQYCVSPSSSSIPSPSVSNTLPTTSTTSLPKTKPVSSTLSHRSEKNETEYTKPSRRKQVTRKETSTNSSLLTSQMWSSSRILHQAFRLLLLLSVSLLCLSDNSDAQRILNVPVIEETKVLSVSGVSGVSAVLPCPLNPHTPGDRTKLVLWYRRGVTKPVISYDGRSPRLTTAPPSHTSPQLTVFRTSASLTLPRLALPLQGLYECRVDFFKSPTHVNLVNLTVIEPPVSATIIDNQGGSSVGGLLGPYPQGSRLLLTCLVRGGIPVPTVTWTRNGQPINIEQTDSHEEQQVLRSDLEVSPLPREWSNGNITCSASNSDLTTPLIAEATIRMYLSAASVVVQGPAATVAGRRARLQCWARGSSPPATLAWEIKGLPLHPHREESSITDGVSTSVVEVAVTPDDNGAIVSCTANNPAVETLPPPTNTTRLVVYYPPTVSVEYGLTIEPRRLKEGDDIYLRCVVSANPPPDKIIWFHEGLIVKQNRSRGIITSRDSLALQEVDRHMAGRYRCSAANHLANATSKPLALKLSYKPVCMMPSTTTYFIYDQPINVTCHVASHPPATRIDWYWNSGNDIISHQPTSSVPEMLTRHPPPSAADWDRSWARLSVRPSKHQEDRQLSCWASNAMGRQEKQCRFFIRVAKTPAPVSSCRLANITASSVSLTCARPAHSQPGSTQYFAEVYEENGDLLANLSSGRPWFNISQLDPGTAYKLKVYVAHGPIASVPVVVSAYTSNTPVQQPSRPTTSGASYSYRGSLVATGVAVALCFIAILVAVIRRVAITSSRNSMAKTLGASSSPPRSPLSKSTASLAGGDEQETHEIVDGGSSGGRSADDLAGFETKITTCAVINRSGVTSDEEIAEYTSLQKKKSPSDRDAKRSITTDLIGETTLSEHQLMLPKVESFYAHRESPEGRKENRFCEAYPRQDFASFPQGAEGWMGAVRGDLVGNEYRAAVDAPKKYR